MAKEIEELIERAKKDGIERFVVGVIILKDGKVLLLRRASDDFLPGIYELPSGKVEQDETLKEAVVREVKEETSLDVKRIIKYFSNFDYLSRSGKRTRQFNFVVEAQGKIRLSEHEDYAWVDKNETSKYNIGEEVKKIINLT